jgi:hypothetical protein
MDNTLKYWQFVRLHASGSRQIEQITAAQAFFEQQFPAGEAAQLSDAAIQRRLFELMRRADDGDAARGDRHLAECCLRCCISHLADWTCRDLETQFGQTAGFTWDDLYSQVLDDFTLASRQGRKFTEQQSEQQSEYQSVASKILQSFESNKGQLNTWTKRLVMAELNSFLLECGIYLISDWALLNGMTPDRFRRLCDRTYQLSQKEIDTKIQLLTAFHLIYRRDRPQTDAKRRMKCQSPNAKQLEEMLNHLATQGITHYSAAELLTELQAIAELIRQARRRSQISIDDPNSGGIVDESGNAGLTGRSPLETLEENEENERKQQFLQHYQKDLLTNLENSLEEGVDQRLEVLKKKESAKIPAYLTALCLFHCQGQSMGKIGKILNLGSQSTVSRFLKLDLFRADVRQTLLLKLRDRILALASTYTDREQLEALDQLIDDILMERIDRIIDEAIAEGSTPNRPRNSLFSVTLCRHLHTRRIEQCLH